MSGTFSPLPRPVLTAAKQLMHLVYKRSSLAAVWWAHTSVSTLGSLWHISFFFKCVSTCSPNTVTKIIPVSPLSSLSTSLQNQSIVFWVRHSFCSGDYPRTNFLTNSILCQRKMAPDKLNKAHFIQDCWMGAGVGRRLNTASLKAKRVGLKYWCELVGRYWKMSGEVGQCDQAIYVC